MSTVKKRVRLRTVDGDVVIVKCDTIIISEHWVALIGVPYWLSVNRIWSIPPEQVTDFFVITETTS